MTVARRKGYQTYVGLFGRYRGDPAHSAGDSMCDSGWPVYGITVRTGAFAPETDPTAGNWPVAYPGVSARIMCAKANQGYVTPVNLARWGSPCAIIFGKQHVVQPTREWANPLALVGGPYFGTFAFGPSAEPFWSNGDLWEGSDPATATMRLCLLVINITPGVRYRVGWWSDYGGPRQYFYTRFRARSNHQWLFSTATGPNPYNENGYYHPDLAGDMVDGGTLVNGTHVDEAGGFPGESVDPFAVGAGGLFGPEAGAGTDDSADDFPLEPDSAASMTSAFSGPNSLFSSATYVDSGLDD